jgi:hypothetical protein
MHKINYEIMKEDQFFYFLQSKAQQIHQINETSDGLGVNIN